MTTDRLLQRPIFGGVFGRGRYAMASSPATLEKRDRTALEFVTRDYTGKENAHG